LLSFGLQIGGAIALMHEKGFAHSDIKALNVFVDRDYWGKLQCYLGDFGLAQILDDSHLIVKAYRVFNIKGLTIPYAAPEVLQRFRSLDPAQINLSWKAGDFQQADVYSYAVLLYEIVNCVYAWEWDVCGNK
jgi:serine/threonine protein kinase